LVMMNEWNQNSKLLAISRLVHETQGSSTYLASYSVQPDVGIIVTNSQCGQYCFSQFIVEETMTQRD
jgi:hypothetical protein